MITNFEISDSELGAKVKAAHQKHLQHIDDIKPIWQVEGSEFRAVREDYHNSSRQFE